MSVARQEGESLERLPRRLRRAVAKARMLSTVRKKRFFTSRSQQSGKARRKAARREYQRQRRQERRYGTV